MPRLNSLGAAFFGGLSETGALTAPPCTSETMGAHDPIPSTQKAAMLRR
jgi:hypothetical protein